MKTFEEIIDEGNKIFECLYKYVKMFKKDKCYFLEIICSKHGTFEKNIYNHLLKQQGCSLCTKPSKLTTEMFINKANEVHNNMYDYSQVAYEGGKTKIKINCNEHGIFEMLPTNHLKGQKCPFCSNRNKVTNELFIQKAIKIHGNKYDYSEVEYVNSQTNVKILCKEHGFFYQMPLNHLKGNQCYKCSNIVKTNDDFVKKSKIIHKDIYDYTKTNYKDARSKVIITCKIHGDFTQSPNDHLSGNGCQKCSIGNYSKICLKWLDEMMRCENIFIQHAGNLGEETVIINGKKIQFDGYCEKTNTVYEFYGDMWHGNPTLYVSTDFNPLNKKTYGELYKETIKREEIIKKAGYNLIILWENQYKNK